MNKFVAEVAEELSLVDNFIESKIDSRFNVVDGRKHSISRDKPGCASLSLLVARLSSFPRDELVLIASAVELLDMAYASHSETLDQFRMKGSGVDDAHRGILLSGDLLFAQSFKILSSLDTIFMECALSSLDKLIQQEFRGKMLLNDIYISLEEYLNCVVAQRAEFFGLSLKMGALACGIEGDELDCLYRFGSSLGVVHVLKEELVSLKAMGKQRSEYPILPIVLYLDSSKLSIIQRRGFINKLKTEGLSCEVEELIKDIMKDRDYIDGVINQYIDSGIKELNLTGNVLLLSTLTSLASSYSQYHRGAYTN